MIGSYTTIEAPGALANGTRVVKVRGEPGDMHAVGAKATVLGSLAAPPDVAAMFYCAFGYFVEWDDHPGTAVFIIGTKIAEDT